jgi:hypothetical protein
MACFWILRFVFLVRSVSGFRTYNLVMFCYPTLERIMIFDFVSFMSWMDN